MKIHRVCLCLAAVMASGAVGCAPSTFVRSAPGWKSIQLREQLAGDYDKAWATAVDAVVREHDIEIMDKDSGYLRTGWKYGILDQPQNAYAGRLTLKFSDTTNPEKLEVKTDAQYWDNGKKLWIQGFDTAFERDVYLSLVGRMSDTAK